jgi:hypothetical protein
VRDWIVARFGISPKLARSTHFSARARLEEAARRTLGPCSKPRVATLVRSRHVIVPPLPTSRLCGDDGWSSSPKPTIA